jgi:BirA family biotin operon repressor/biotin-[acetyl-CoA-carboxylase] ligase
MIGQSFIVLNTIESTNNHAMKLVREGKASHGMAFFALEQTQGKGQRNKSWLSNLGENLLTSVVLDCKNYELNQQFSLSMATSLACFNLLKKYGGDEMSIKWPNDLYWRDRKAGGILIENIIIGNHWETAVLGIGINVNQTKFPEMHRNPVSLKQISGKVHDPIEMAKELCIELEKMTSFITKEKSGELLLLYNNSLYKKDQLVRFNKNNLSIEARVKGVDMDGNLMLEGDSNPTIAWGDMEWVD